MNQKTITPTITSEEQRAEEENRQTLAQIGFTLYEYTDGSVHGNLLTSPDGDVAASDFNTLIRGLYYLLDEINLTALRTGTFNGDLLVPLASYWHEGCVFFHFPEQQGFTLSFSLASNLPLWLQALLSAIKSKTWEE